MNELVVNIGGSNRGFQVATEDTKRIARDLQRSLEQYTPQTWKPDIAAKERYGALLDPRRIEHAEGAVRGLREGIAGIGEELAGGVAATLAGFVSEEMIRQTVEYGEQISNTSKQLGISTDAVQMWGYALRQSGASMESMSTFFVKMASSRDEALGGGEGAEKSINAFQKLGVTIDDLKSKRLEDIGGTIAETIKGGDVQELLGSLREVGGRGAAEMVAAFKNGMKELGDEAKELGVVMDTATVGKLAEAGEKFKTIGAQFKAGLAPFVSWLADGIELWINIFARLGRFVGGFSVDGIDGGMRAVRQFNEELEKKEKEKKERANAKPGRGLADAGEGKADEKAEEKAAKDRVRLEKEYHEALEQTATTADKLALIAKDIDQADTDRYAAQRAGDYNAYLAAQIELMKKRKEYADTAETFAKQGNDRLVKKETPEHVDTLAAMGGFASAASIQNQTLDVQRRQLEKLDEISKNTRAHHSIHE